MARGPRRVLASAGPLAVVVLALALAGCGGGSGGGGSASTGPAGSASTDGTVPVTPIEAQTEPKPGQGQSPAPPTGSPVAGLPPADQVDFAVKGVLASGVPQLACEQAATANYVDTTFGSRAGCERSTVPGSAATYVIVSAIKISGDRATASAKPHGGPSNGETIKVKLVREDGIWKVDSLRSNAPVGP